MTNTATSKFFLLLFSPSKALLGQPVQEHHGLQVLGLSEE
jgi:hypothetical protein